MAKRRTTKKRTAKKTPKQSFTVVVTSQSKLALLFQVKPRTIESWKASGMPGETGKWSLREILAWLRTAGPWRPRAMPNDDDPLMTADTDSPALERYRLARAKMVELELAEKEGFLVDLHVMRELHGRMAAVNRRFATRLQAEFGERGRELYDDWLTSSQRAGEKYFAGVIKPETKK